MPARMLGSLDGFTSQTWRGVLQDGKEFARADVKGQWWNSTEDGRGRGRGQHQARFEICKRQKHRQVWDCASSESSIATQGHGILMQPRPCRACQRMHDKVMNHIISSDTGKGTV